MLIDLMLIVILYIIISCNCATVRNKTLNNHSVFLELSETIRLQSK